VSIDLLDIFAALSFPLTLGATKNAGIFQEIIHQLGVDSFSFGPMRLTYLLAVTPPKVNKTLLRVLIESLFDRLETVEFFARFEGQRPIVLDVFDLSRNCFDGHLHASLSSTST
jgi:hypothetical protein